MKRWLSLLLALVLILSAVSMTVLAVNPFTDVPQSQWYYADIDHAYQNGLINGKTATLYKPDDFLTYAEAVKLAAAMNQRYTTGSVTLQNGMPWYQTYVDYCKTKGIIDVDYQWNQPATRAGYIEIFAHALPDSAMTEINDVPDGAIPDVPMSHPQAAPIYKLYRVGILQGNNLQRTCNPGANIKRSEVAAILTRMMDSSKRIQFSMNTEALRFTKNPDDVTVNPGETATLSVEVTGGKTPYKYQWSMSRDGAREQWYDVSGKTEATISVKTDASAAGATMVYRCKITDAAGTTLYSDLGSITVSNSELKIKTQPVGGTKKPGEYMTPFVEAEGGKQPYTYQWEAADGNTWLKVPGATAAALNMGVGESAVGEDLIYRCVVTDANGKSVTSDSAVFKIVAAESPLKIKTQPVGGTVKPGTAGTLSVEAEGGKAPYTYQWQTYLQISSAQRGRWVDVSGQTSANLRVLIPADAGQGEQSYRCVVTDYNGASVTSDSATIVVENTATEFTVTGSAPSSVKRGETATLKVNVSGGTKPYKFVWMGYNADDYSQGFTTSVIYWDGVTLSADGSTLTIDTSKCEAKQFKCDVTDGNGNKQRVEFEFQVNSY